MAEFKYPLWVRQMAAHKANEKSATYKYGPDEMESSSALRALCAMVEGHCEEPEDPLLQEAREICAEAAEAYNDLSDADCFREGHYDSLTEMRSTMIALKRYKPGAS